MSADNQGYDYASTPVGAPNPQGYPFAPQTYQGGQEYDFSPHEILCILSGISHIILAICWTAMTTWGEIWKSSPSDAVWSGITFVTEGLLGLALCFSFIKKEVIIKIAIFASFSIFIILNIRGFFIEIPRFIDMITDTKTTTYANMNTIDRQMVLLYIIGNIFCIITSLVFPISLLKRLNNYTFRVFACLLLIALQAFFFLRLLFIIFGHGFLFHLGLETALVLFCDILSYIAFCLLAISFLPRRKKAALPTQFTYLSN